MSVMLILLIEKSFNSIKKGGGVVTRTTLVSGFLWSILTLIGCVTLNQGKYLPLVPSPQDCGLRCGLTDDNNLGINAAENNVGKRKYEFRVIGVLISIHNYNQSQSQELVMPSKLSNQCSTALSPLGNSTRESIR